MSGSGAERPTKRLRRLSTEYDDSEANDDWTPVKDKLTERQIENDDNVAHVGSRSRRSNREPSASAAASRPSTTGDGGATKSIRLTMKAPGDSSRDSAGGSKKSTINPSRDSFEAAGVVTGPRGTRAKRPIVDEDSESEEEDRSGDEDEEDEEEEEEEEEAEDGEQEDDGDEEEEDDEEEEVEVEDEEEEEDQEGSEEDNEDADAEGESDEDIRPTQANGKAASGTSLLKAHAGKSRARPVVTRPPLDKKSGRVEDVKDKSTDDDDREMSAVDSDGNRVSEDGDGAEDEADADADAEENVGEQADDAEEEEDEGEEDEDDDDDDDDDEDDEGATPATGSRASTPDLSKMTKRQRSRLVELGGELLQLPSETKVKKVLTAEEHAMRRAEMARRRKNLSEKRKEEEKIDTINKLLKKQAPKQRRTARNPEAGGDASPSNQEAEFEKPKDIFVRWVSSSRGNVVGVPEEWIGTAVGKVFESSRGDEHTAKKERRPMLKTVLIKT
ncbi:MAG: hypothetical protein M1815_001014 [Lichina confinis]|nr:MAG: hypothetical protein M1815_001014 [Lichina confinis]